MKYSRGLVTFFVLAFSVLVFAAAVAVDRQASGISITFKQEGVPVDAAFTRFSGTVDYDPANAAAASVQLSVDVGSFDIGDAEYNKEVQKKTWFNAAQYPQATFASSSIKAQGADKLQVQGKLTIKGRTLDVAVPVTIKQEGKMRIFTGVVPIKRLYFNIGEGEWKDTDTLADEVVIKFKIANPIQ